MTTVTEAQLNVSRTALQDHRTYSRRLDSIVTGLRQAHVEVPAAVASAQEICSQFDRLHADATRSAQTQRHAVTILGSQRIVEALAAGIKPDTAEIARELRAADREARDAELLLEALNAAVMDLADENGDPAAPREALLDHADEIHNALDASLQTVITKARAALADLGGYLPTPSEAVDYAGSDELETYRNFTRDLTSQYGRLRDVQTTVDAFLYEVTGGGIRSAAELAIVEARNIDHIHPGWAGPTWLDSSDGQAVDVPAPWDKASRLSQLAFHAAHLDSQPWIPTMADRARALDEQLAIRSDRQEAAKALAHTVRY